MGFFTDTMTVYNYYTDPNTERDMWRRSSIKGVQWTHGKRQIGIVNGIATESIVESITIDFERQYEGRKTYVDPMEYAELSEVEAEKYWTLNQQDGMDYIALGEISLEIKKPSELRENCKYQGAVISVADNRNRPRLKHIKVVAK